MLFENGTPQENSSRMKEDAAELSPVLNCAVMEMFQSAIDSNELDKIHEALVSMGLQDFGLLGSRGYVYSCAALSVKVLNLVKCDGPLFDYQFREFPRTMGLRQAIINATKKEV